MPNFSYVSFKQGLMTGQHDLIGDTIKVALVTDVYTPNHETHTSYTTHVAPHEVTGTGYTGGGATLGGKAIATGNNFATLTANNVTWNPSTITARYAVVYNDTVAGKPLIKLIDFSQNRSSTNGNFELNWAAVGLIRISD